MERTRSVTSEYVPAGEGCPSWLFHALSCPNEHAPFMVLHPTELHRQRTLERLHEAGVVVAPQYHLTLNRLVRLLHVDLRLPVLLDDEASTFMALHARCAEAAENAELPFLHTPGVGGWTLTKTRRLQQLHGELLQLRRPFAWEETPVLRCFTASALKLKSSPAGCSLRSLHGMFWKPCKPLPTLRFTSARSPVSWCLTWRLTLPKWNKIFSPRSQGSRRSTSCSIQARSDWATTVLTSSMSNPATDTLPGWVPSHEVWSGDVSGWQTEVGARLTQLTRVPG